ncbi:hypothetical protein P7H20_25480 [Paenibacillus larvae]|nr:hypothetical protein [Paenibacillus larvae]MDT2277520.1 hypothetical protein [Paenibacillus larvae]
MECTRYHIGHARDVRSSGRWCIELGTADITSDTMQALGTSADRATHAADVSVYARQIPIQIEMLGEG